ncbi:MAG: hypothetical protein A4E66_02480 [Syntrophus sp. PtaB.Bin001]|nr:MAG: hypothetical protein A4E66_02480 [Syntrophus sp. PtaB.Bin001]
MPFSTLSQKKRHADQLTNPASLNSIKEEIAPVYLPDTQAFRRLQVR